MKDKILSYIDLIVSNNPNMHGEIAIAYRDNIFWHQNFSYPDAPWKVSKNAQYLIGSITKQFTAVALLQALQDIYLNYGSDSKSVETFIEESLQRPIAYYFDEATELFSSNIPEWINRVTLHQLLTHTSGIKKRNEVSFEDILEIEPGKRFQYANPNYVLIGKIITCLTKVPLDQYFYEKLFLPAGMNQTYLPMSGTPKQLKVDKRFERLALGFEYNLVPSVTTFNSAANKINFSELDVAGGIVSTVKDLLNWQHALYAGKILPLRLLDKSTRGYISKDSHPLYDGLNPLKYGYGVEVFNQSGKRCYQHSGGVPGYQARLIFLPEHSISIVHLSNSKNSDDEYQAMIKKISKMNNVDTNKSKEIFNVQYPNYENLIRLRANIFKFSNEIRDLFIGFI